MDLSCHLLTGSFSISGFITNNIQYLDLLQIVLELLLYLFRL